MLDRDLAEMYGVPTGRLNEQVKRNLGRFPPDFMFRLSKAETANWISQIAISNPGLKMGVRWSPCAFTEQGVAMLSSVLRSKRAVQVNVEIMRAFVRLRDLVAHDQELARRLDALESKHDRQFKVVFDAIRELMSPPMPAPRRRIGFISTDEDLGRKAQKR